MPDAYETHDARLVQETTIISAADALYVQSDPVPANKVWTILSATYTPSVAETRVCCFERWGRSGNRYPVNFPQSIALDPSVIVLGFPTDTMELKLWPGERFGARRAAATAGSTMYLLIEWVETDLPLYEYIEPQIKKRVARAASDVRRVLGGMGGGGGASSPPARGGGGAPIVK